MLVTELKERLINKEPIFEVINIKPYLSYIEKKILCENIINGSLEQNENNLTVCNYFNRKLISDIGFISSFTDIELGEEFLEDYDFLCEQGIVDYVFNNMNKSDRYFIKEMVSKNIEQEIRIGNSLENIISSKLQKIIDVIPNEKSLKKLMSDLPKQINKIKPENMEILKGMFNKQGDTNNK